MTSGFLSQISKLTVFFFFLGGGGGVKITKKADLRFSLAYYGAM